MARVLIVGDNRAVSGMLSSVIDRLGHQVSVVHSGRAGLQWMHACSPPDLVLTDLKMQRGDGRQLIASMRQDLRLAAVPVIVVTGASAEGLEGRCAAVVHKPFDIHALSRLVGRVLRLVSSPCA